MGEGAVGWDCLSGLCGGFGVSGFCCPVLTLCSYFVGTGFGSVLPNLLVGNAWIASRLLIFPMAAKEGEGQGEGKGEGQGQEGEGQGQDPEEGSRRARGPVAAKTFAKRLYQHLFFVPPPVRQSESTS